MAGVIERVDGPGGGRSRVVDLMRETSGERAQGDQGLPLPGRRLNGPGGVVQPSDEMPAEREPGVDLLTQHVHWHPEHPAAGGPPGGRQVDALLVPGAEPPGPPARHIHPAHHGVLRTDTAQQVDGTVDEQPPEVRLLTLMEQLDAGLDANLGTALGQFRELIVGHAVEQADSAQLVAAHHIIAWLLMRSASGGRPPEERLEGRMQTSAQTISALPRDPAARMVRCRSGELPPR